MRAVRVGPGQDRLVVEPVKPTKRKFGKIRVRIEYGGICGSDLHYAIKGRNGQFEVTEPLTRSSTPTRPKMSTPRGIASSSIRLTRPPKKVPLKMSVSTVYQAEAIWEVHRRHRTSKVDSSNIST